MIWTAHVPILDIIVPFHMHRKAQRAALYHLKRRQIRNLPHLLLVENVNVPCVIVKRLILKHLQDIPTLPMG